MAKTKVTPEINFDLSDTESSPVVGRVDGEDVRGEQKVRSMGGRLGFRADTEGMSYGAGVSGGTAKGELDLPSVLEQFGAPDKVKFGSGKIKPQDYDAFLEMADIFGIEGATARVEAGYTPSDYEEDKKRIALKLKYNFASGGIMPDDAREQAMQDAKDIDTGVDTRSKKEMLEEQMSGLGSASKTAVEQLPGVGEVVIAKDIVDDVSSGDYASAGLNVAALGVGFLPAGDILNKPIRAAAKKFRKQDAGVADKMLKDIDSIDTWKKQNPNPKPQKQNLDVEKAANDLLDGSITGKQYRSVVKGNMPIVKIEKVPEVPSFTEIVGALDKDKSAKGILGLNKTVKDGTRVASRLDIPAYERFNKWIVSVHDAFDKKGRESLNGDIMGYGKTAILKNVEFKGMSQGAANIAAKKNAKGTIARIFGDYYNAEPENVAEYAAQAIKDKNWTQVGYNPFRHGFFYDKNTGMPIKSAEEVIQVGPLVLAKNAQKIKISEAKQVSPKGGIKIRTGKPVEGLQNLKETKTVFNEGGAVLMKDQMSMFEDGGLMDEGGSVDPVSGNDVPPGSTQEEVRDDIPAQLSEGEFVFPADVVRFIGLGNLMQMRQQAKMGLKQMEAMGQMGNSDEATMPDDLPFDVNDLDMEDEDEYTDRQEFAVGGMPSNIQTQQSSFADYTLPTYNNNMVQPTNTMYTPPTQQYTPVASPTTTFDFGAMDGVASGPPDEYKTYTNESGQELSVPFKDGKVLSTFTVPEGYKLKTEEVKVENDTSTAPSTSVLPESGGQSDEYPDGPPESFATTDVRGIGYDRGKIDNELLTTELGKIGKGQAKVLASGYSPVSKAAQLAKADIQNKIATSDKLSSVVDVKGTVRDANKEFLTSQKVAIDSFFNDPKYADVKTENLHNLSPEVKQALAVEIQTNRISLENSMKGKSQAELDAEKTSLADKYGLTTTVRDPRTNKDREKTYGQIYAESRAAQKRRDEAKAAKAAKAAADAAAADRRSRGKGYGLGGEYGEGSGSMGGSEAEQKGAEEGGYQTSTGEAMVARGGLMDKDKLNNQMKRSGLASK